MGMTQAIINLAIAGIVGVIVGLFARNQDKKKM